jgi:hypothetical protein
MSNDRRRNRRHLPAAVYPFIFKVIVWTARVAYLCWQVFRPDE